MTSNVSSPASAKQRPSLVFLRRLLIMPMSPQHLTNPRWWPPSQQLLGKPHQNRDWLKSVESVRALCGLTDVANERLEPGRFEPLWSDEALADPPPLPANPSFKDQLAWNSAKAEQERRIAKNSTINAQCESWFKSKNHEYFILITDSMKKTQPGLRDLLRDRCDAGDGFYDGVAAMKTIKSRMKEQETNHPQHDYYDGVLELISKKRLQSGCSERDFLAIARRFLFDVNPFLRAPLTMATRSRRVHHPQDLPGRVRRGRGPAGGRAAARGRALQARHRPRPLRPHREPQGQVLRHPRRQRHRHRCTAGFVEVDTEPEDVEA